MASLPVIRRQLEQLEAVEVVGTSVEWIAGAREGIFMAGLGHFKVISVDYRMPPEAYFPAAIDDVLTVLKAAQRTTAPGNIGVFGTSAGGALTLSTVLRAKENGVPLPGAISVGTPMSDVTKTGDSFFTSRIRRRATTSF